MAWCEYCKGSSNYVCSLNDKYIPSSYIDDYCKYDYRAYKCPFYKEYGPSQSNCFITTVTCDILGKDDNDLVMQKLRGFRDNILQKNEDYYEILKMYDVIGPVIASKLKNDPEKDLFTKTLYSILERVTLLIDKEEYDLAVEKYRVMTLLLINRYNLKHLFNKEADSDFGYNDDNFDPTIAGHGIKLVNSNIPKM